MLSIDFQIGIGKYWLMMIEAVDITKSVDNLADTAIISLPGSVFNQRLEIEEQISEGNEVIIRLGYDGELKDEFAGYVESVSTDNGTIKINCEDELFKYRTDVPNKEFTNTGVKQILQWVNQQIGNTSTVLSKHFDLNCDFDFQYDKFTVYNATGFDVLKKIQEDTKANVYLKGKTLHVHPQYAEIGATVIYDFSKNIEKADLKYRDASKRKVLVEVKGTKLDGSIIKATVGTAGGNKINWEINGIRDYGTLEKIAHNQYEIETYTGYEGNIAGWLMPFVEHGDAAEIRDDEYPEKNGKYYIKSVKTTVSRNGGVRKINVGKKISV